MGVPSKIHDIPLVQIQPEERLATHLRVHGSMQQWHVLLLECKGCAGHFKKAEQYKVSAHK